MTRTTKVSLGFLAGFVAILAWLSMRIPQVECEVCITFQGHNECRKAASGTKKAAMESAVTSACGTLAAGMTETINCENTAPDRVTCTGG